MCADVFRQKYGKVLKYILICELEPNTIALIKILDGVLCQLFFPMIYLLHRFINRF